MAASIELWVTPTLRCALTDQGIRFSDSSAGALQFPLSTVPADAIRLRADLVRCLALENLWADGVVTELEDGGWLLPFDALYHVNHDVRTVLTLPELSDVAISVNSAGSPGNEGFGIAVEVSHPALGVMEHAMDRFGPVYLPSKQSPVLIPRPAWELLTLRDEKPVGRDLVDHLEYLAKVQRKALECGAGLDSFLTSQEVVAADSVGVTVEELGPERLRISPRVTAGAETQVASELLECQDPPRVVRAAGSGSSTRRVILTTPVRETLRRIQLKASVEGIDVPRFIENPEAYLPSGVDLSDYSSRVTGFRTLVYNSRPYLHLRPSDGGWFEGVPGIELEPSVDAGGLRKPRQVTGEEYRRLTQAAVESGQEFVRYGDGWLRVNQKAIGQLHAALADATVDPSGTLRFSTRAMLQIYENIDSLEYELPPAETIGLHRNLTQFPDPPIPDSLHCSLMPYQRVGYRWLAYLSEKGMGGLLADDMGLGKTVQVIAHLAGLADQGKLLPSLVVCPKTLIENWLNELSRFFPSQDALVYFGQDDVRGLASRGVVVTSYDTLRHRQLELAKIDWQCVVCDEAQYAKNPTAQRTVAVKALKSHHRVALTGTPVENGLIELWCILDFVRPGHLGSWADFRDRFERPLVEVTTEEQRRPVVEELLTHLGPHYLRRLKDDVLPDLPPKREQVVEVGFGEQQFDLYCDIARRGKSGGRGEALAAITKLIMVCAHPRVVDSSKGEFSYAVAECPKLDATIEILRAIKAIGEKALVFTRFVSVQGLLQRAIFDALGFWPDVVNGQMTGSRQRVIDIFERRDGFGVLILSHDVGGLGLNITSASHVIHYTRPWNPARENQGTDRAHRIGQKHPVTVHYPLVSDARFTTVEVKLASLLSSKRGLARDVLRPTTELEIGAADLLECLETA